MHGTSRSIELVKRNIRYKAPVNLVSVEQTDSRMLRLVHDQPDQLHCPQCGVPAQQEHLSLNCYTLHVSTHTYMCICIYVYIYIYMCV